MTTAQQPVKLDTKKLSKQVASIRDIAKKENWKVDYDKDIDQLFFTPKNIPKDTFLVSFDDISLYLNKNSDVKGMFIEYFSHNFVEHDKDIKPAVHIFIDMPKGKSKEEKQFAEEIIKKELELKTIQAVYEQLENKPELAVAV